MNDINFDELDKAVNSVLNSSKRDEKTDDQVRVEEQSQTITPEESVTKAVEAKPAEPDEGSPAPQTTTGFIPQKRRGQFMDMVHPSSDMTKAGEIPSIRRATQKLAPLSPEIMEADAGAKQTAQAEMIESSPPPEAEQVPDTEGVDVSEHTSESDITDVAIEREWPDPLELVNEEKETAGLADEQDAPEVSPDLREDAPSFTDIDTPDESALEVTEQITEQESAQDSPFIESVDVEKRPLGAFAGDDSEVSEVTEVTQVDAAEAQEEIAPIARQEEHEEKTPIATEPSSIVQQYKVAAEETDTEEHAVFDTEQYHQPLAPERVKKNHGLLYTLLAILMITLGAGVGYAVFVLRLL